MWRSFLFPTRTVGTLKGKYCDEKHHLKKLISGTLKSQILTESCRPCLAACRVEPAQLQN